jgi:hypothetical protein
MIINNFNSFLRKTLLISMLFLSVTTLKAQLTGTKLIPGDYASLDLAIADLNTQGVGAGGVTLNLVSSNPQTAPLGGYVIGGAGSLVLTTASAANPITITGNSNVVTAPASQVSGQLFDGVFKIVGADYVTIQGFTLNENAANTTITAATNNMTEWGIALLYSSVTDGCQNISLLNNTIALGATYQNAIGVYANSTHAAGTPTTSATATGLTGGNHNLVIKGNTISNVNLGIVVVGPTAVADMNNNVSIGGTTASEGNTITYGLTGTFSSYTNVSGTVNGILVRNSINATVSNNALTSNGTVTAGTLNGIHFPAFSATPTATFTQNINNNTIAIRSNILTGAVNGITQPSGSASLTSICNVNNNNFTNFGHATATASGTLTFITTVSAHFTTNINFNTFTNVSVNTTGSVTFISHSYSMPANGTKSVSNNAIVTGFTKTGAGGTVTFMTTNGSSPNSAFGVYSNNTISNITLTGATTLNGINDTDGAGTGANKVFNGNTISNINGGTSTVTGLNSTYWGGTSSSISNNTLSNINGQGTITGINLGSSFSGATNSVINGNSITGLTSSGVGGTVTGLSCSNTSVGILISNTVITGLSSTGASVVTGINISGSNSTSLVANKIHTLSSSNAGGSVNGILVSSGTLSTLTNNLIGNLTAPNANAANPINGINITGGTAVNAFYNSVYLNASSSGALFGSSAISVSSTPTVTLRNNIFINESAFNGAAFAVAMRRSSTTLTSYSNASNNNLLYAGTPSANNLILYDGTNSYSTMLAYQTAVLPRDANSITGEAAFTGTGFGIAGNFFISLTGSSADFLRPVAGITTQAESGAANISGITTDYSASTRAGNAGYVGTGSNPDMGAYEFAGVSPAPVITLNSVTPSTATQCAAAARTISVNVTTISGTITAVNLGYSVNGVPQTAIVMTNTSGTTWEGIIPVATPGNATIAWAVSATNSLALSSSYAGTAYSDEPLTGVTASANASISTVCANDPSSLTVNLLKSGSAAIGSGSTVSTNSPAVTPFYGGYGGVKTQYLIRANELTAMGFSAGNFTQLSVNITSAGSTLNGFAISAETTALNALTTNIENVGNQVFTSASFVPVVGVNNFPFSTPLAWDGVSNIIVNFCWSNNNTSNTVSNLLITTTSFVSGNARYVDSKTSAEVCGYSGSALPAGWNGAATTVSSRPIFTFVGNLAPAITSVTWMNGATTVGTGNPLTVNPTITTTYTATITSAGCTVSPAPTVSVTVNPLPTAPTASNSAQCGTQIPTAAVTSTSGLSAPTFKWYDAAVAGTVMQNSTSTTYTSNIAATTTFYVAEVNTTTGCESPRTAITVTVAIADGISATINNATICIGSSVTLTATNTNATPNQSYTYTWTGVAGSGLSTVTGNTAIVTPTLPGTYAYNLAGADGGCNAVSSVNLTVNPFVAAITAVNVTCNAGNNGTFALGSTTCGTAPYTYSVDGGTYGSIPTNLIAGTYSVLVKDANGYISAALPLTITQPATTIANPTVTDASVCQNSASASVTASATTSVPTPQTTTVNFSLLAQPVEVNAAPGSVISTLTLPVLPAGAVITGLTLNCNGLIPNGGEYQSDAKLGLSGAFTNAAAAGTGTIGFGTVAGVPYNYTRSIPTAGFPTNGGTLNLLFWDDFNDVVGGPDVTFPIGSSAVTLTIDYTIPSPATITWWDAATNGTQIGTSSPFETVGTSILPTTATPGVYTFYAQGQNGACPSPGRTAVTVTVNALPIVNAGTDQTICEGTAVTLSGTIAGGTWSGPVTIADGVAFTPPAGVHTFTYSVTNASGCTSTDDVIVTVNALPIVNAGTDQTICEGTAVTLSGTIAGGTWSGPLTITDGVAFTAPVGVHTFTYSVTNASGCTSTDDVIVTVNALPVVNAGVDQSVCDGNTLTLSGTIAGGTWSGPLTITDGVAFTAPVGVHTFTYSVTNASGCTSTDDVIVTVNALPVVNAGVDQSVCDGNSVTLSGTVAGGTWSGPLTITDGVAFTAPVGVHTFTYSVTNTSGCTNTDDVVVTVNTVPVATATDNGDATITAGTAATYQWIDCATNTAIAGATSQTLTVTVNGTYAVIASNGSCSDTSDCVTIDYMKVSELSLDAISIYPNPTRDNVTVTMTSASASIEIIDAQGKLLKATQVVNGDKIDLSTYETGMYIFRVKTENGTSIFRVSKN